MELFFQISFCPISQTVADKGFVLFSFFNVIWFSIYLEAWKRYCSELAYKWGTLDQRDELLVEPRPLFKVSFHALSLRKMSLRSYDYGLTISLWQKLIEIESRGFDFVKSVE